MSLELGEFARRCVALAILVQKDEGPSFPLADPAGLAVFLTVAKTEYNAQYYSYSRLEQIVFNARVLAADCPISEYLTVVLSLSA